MVDLKTTYLGLPIKNPLVAAASPLTKKVDLIKKLEDAGISAVVLYSLFEEEIQHESLELNHFLTKGTESYAEAITYFPEMEKYEIGVEKYLNHIKAAKEAVEIPVIASLNGISTGGWVETAKKIEQAGADALELNIYFMTTEIETTGDELEQAYIELVSDVRAQLSIPLAVKLSPFFTSLPNMAKRLVDTGADGLVLFNRFLQPDLDIDQMEVNTELELSTSSELRLPLRWTAILYHQIKADLALSTGVHQAVDMAKAIMAGANVVQVASRLIHRGPAHAEEMLFDFKQWMTQHEYETIDSLRGSMSQQAVKEPAAFERANYMKMLRSYDNKVR